MTEKSTGDEIVRHRYKLLRNTAIAGRWTIRTIVLLVLVYGICVWAYFQFFNSGIRKPSPRSEYTHEKILLPPPQEIPLNNVVRVLAIDGGGVKGLIPLQMLKAIEEQAGKPIHELFDYMIGTSTGGIIVTSLSIIDENGKAKWSTEDMIKEYKKLSKSTFTVSLPHKILTVNGLIGAKLECNKIDRLFREHYGDVRLSELSTTVSIPSFQLDDNNITLFNSRIMPEHSHWTDYRVSDVVSGITAAPIYFRPVQLSDIEGKNTRTIMDGAVFVNNPSTIGAHASLALYPKNKVVLISIGTGLEEGFTGDFNSTFWGLAQWAEVLYPVTFKGQSLLTDWMLRLCQSNPNTPLIGFYRFNINIDVDANHWQWLDPEQIKELDKKGKDMVKQNQDVLDELIPILLDPSIENARSRIRKGAANTLPPPGSKQSNLPQ